VLRSNGDGTFAKKTDYATGVSPWSAALGDLNGDHKLDLVTANRDDNTISVLLGQGHGTFATKVDSPVGDSPWEVILVDVNADARLDLVVVSSYYFSVLLGNGDGTFAP